MIQNELIRKKWEGVTRLTLKLLQFLISIYLIFSLYNIGPHWILLIACLAIPAYGIYLMIKAPNRTLCHPLPYVRYKALIRTKSWLRIDSTICATMTCVCFGFSLILLFGYFKINIATPYFLQAAMASLLLAFLYLFNALVAARQIQTAFIDFYVDQQPFVTKSSQQSPLPVDTNISNCQFTHKLSFQRLQPKRVALLRLPESYLTFNNHIDENTDDKSTMSDYFNFKNSNKISDVESNVNSIFGASQPTNSSQSINCYKNTSTNRLLATTTSECQSRASMSPDQLNLPAHKFSSGGLNSPPRSIERLKKYSWFNMDDEVGENQKNETSNKMPYSVPEHNNKKEINNQRINFSESQNHNKRTAIILDVKFDNVNYREDKSCQKNEYCNQKSLNILSSPTISTYKTATQPYNRRAVPLPKLSKNTDQRKSGINLFDSLPLLSNAYSIKENQYCSPLNNNLYAQPKKTKNNTGQIFFASNNLEKPKASLIVNAKSFMPQKLKAKIAPETIYETTIEPQSSFTKKPPQNEALKLSSFLSKKYLQANGAGDYTDLHRAVRAMAVPLEMNGENGTKNNSSLATSFSSPNLRQYYQPLSSVTPPRNKYVNTEPILTPIAKSIDSNRENLIREKKFCLTKNGETREVNKDLDVNFYPTNTNLFISGNPSDGMLLPKVTNLTTQTFV